MHISSDTDNGNFIDSVNPQLSITAVGDTRQETNITKFGGTSIAFDGAHDYLVVETSDHWDFGDQDFTVDFWLKPNTTSTRETIVERFYNTAGTKSFWIEKFYDKIYFRYSSDGSNEFHLYSSIINWDTNDWQHIAVVRDGTDIRFFIDGIAHGTGNIGTDSIYNSETLPLNIGYFNNIGTGYRYFNGYLDELRISNEALCTSNFAIPVKDDYSAVPEASSIFYIITGAVIFVRFLIKEKS